MVFERRNFQKLLNEHDKNPQWTGAFYESITKNAPRRRGAAVAAVNIWPKYVNY